MDVFGNEFLVVFCGCHVKIMIMCFHHEMLGEADCWVDALISLSSSFNLGKLNQANTSLLYMPGWLPFMFAQLLGE